MNTLVSNEILESDPLIIELRYAFASSKEKNWIITKTNRSFVPKGYKLIYTLECISSNQNICIKYTYPSVGDIVSDCDGVILEILSVK